MNKKYYDPEENFEINLEMAYKADNLHYKGVKTHYIEDTNTLIFSLDREESNDADDLETIIYRNYTVNDIKLHIDYNFAKNIYDGLEPMYSGYPTEDNYRKELIKNIKSTKYENMKNVSSNLDYSLSPYDLIRLANEYKKNNKSFNSKVEYLLTDLNFHTECSMLINNDIDELIENNKLEIRKNNETYILDIFKVQYDKNAAKHGYIPINSKLLSDVSEYDLKYLQYEGYLSQTLNGYELSDNYILKMNNEGNKYYLNKDKIREEFESGEGFALQEIYNELNEQGFSYDNNEDAKAVSALISLYDFVNFCETTANEYFSDKFTEYWDLYTQERDKILDDLEIGRDVLGFEYNSIKSIQSGMEK